MPHRREIVILMLGSIVRRALLLIGAVVLVACSVSRAPLTGRVLDAYTNQPIKGVRVQVGTRQAVTTDKDGRYTTYAWSIDEPLQLEAPGYEVATLMLADTPALAQVTHNAPPALFDVLLRPNTLTGVVMDPNTHQPIAGARVRVSDTISTTTDITGEYLLEGVPERFEVVVSAPNYAEARAVIDQQTALDVALLPNRLHGLVKDKATGQPLAGVEVTAGDVRSTTAADGTYELGNVAPDTKVGFTHDGYTPVTHKAPQTMTLDAELRRERITGRVVDAHDDHPLNDVELIATSTPTGTAVASTRTSADGRYTLDNVATDMYITALLPGYRRAQVQVRPGQSRVELKLERFEAKALYLSANRAATGMPLVNTYFDIIKQTELNSMVLDVKSDTKGDYGVIYYQSQAPAVVAAGTSTDLMPIREILAEAKRRNIYMIARIQVFSHDNALLPIHPDWYVQQNGAPWFADGGAAWLDPYDERVWEYNIQLAVEVAQLGFDEIQFDYVRFPTDGNLTGIVFKGPYDWRNDPQSMYGTIGRFTERAQRAINNAGAFFSVDVFGYAAWSPVASIGQNLQIMGKYLDYVYPMTYPSHFAPNELGFKNAAAQPYAIVDHTLNLIQGQLVGEAGRAKVRPWLQDFTMTWGARSQQVPYGVNEVRAQIDAVEANRAKGVAGWALWNLDGRVTVEALKAP